MISDHAEVAPVAISYRPKQHDYLPVVVASIREHLGSWPIVLLTEEQHKPPQGWLDRHEIDTITDWSHSPRANKVFRLWEHQEIFARRLDAWIWWHDDMLLLRPLEDPVAVFEAPLIRNRQKKRPNEKLGNWDNWLWETLAFFRCQNIYAPNPVLHTPRVIRRDVLQSLPENWNRKRLLFEPTYLLWYWHQSGIRPELAENFRKSCFSGEVPAIEELQERGYTILNWGKQIDHEKVKRYLDYRYPTDFG